MQKETLNVIFQQMTIRYPEKKMESLNVAQLHLRELLIETDEVNIIN